MDLPETFKVIARTSYRELEREVNGYKRNGWVLAGPFFQDPRTGQFFQAVERPVMPTTAQQQELRAA